MDLLSLSLSRQDLGLYLFDAGIHDLQHPVNVCFRGDQRRRKRHPAGAGTYQQTAIRGSLSVGAGMGTTLLVITAPGWRGFTRRSDLMSWTR